MIARPHEPLRLPAASAEQPVTVDVRISRRTSQADRVVSLLLQRPDGQPMPAWSPGAHIDVILPDGIERQYSLCGDPHDLRQWQIAVLREPASRGGSEYICTELSEGDTIRVRGPRNHFDLLAAESYGFIAGGIGITPILPMIEQVERLKVPWRLLYGGRHRDSMAFLDRLAVHSDSVTVWPQDSHGLLDLSAFLGAVAPSALVYSCGPEPLLAAIEAQTATWAPGRVHMERFRPRPGALDGPAGEFEVHLAMSEITVAVASDESIVDALERVGVPVATSCREGTCGTCETTVLDGVPDHRDSFLSPEEQADNATMMICCSRSRTPSLTLDV